MSYTPVVLDGGEHIFANVRSPEYVPGTDVFYVNFNLLDTDVTQADTHADTQADTQDDTQDDTQAGTYSGEILRNIIKKKIPEGKPHDWKFVKGFRIIEDESYSYSQTDEEILIFKGDHDKLLDEAYTMYISMSVANRDLQRENKDLKRENEDLQRDMIILNHENESLLDMRGRCHGQGGLLAFQEQPLEVLQKGSDPLSSDTEPRVAGKRGGGSKYKPKRRKSKIKSKRRSKRRSKKKKST